jgi:hypothetical protein
MMNREKLVNKRNIKVKFFINHFLGDFLIEIINIFIIKIKSKIFKNFFFYFIFFVDIYLKRNYYYKPILLLFIKIF